MIYLTKRAAQDLALGALSAEFDFDESCRLATVYMHASVSISEEVTVTMVSASGSTFDTVIDAKTLRSEQDYVYAAVGDVALNQGDKIKVAVTNANTTGKVYVTVKVAK